MRDKSPLALEKRRFGRQKATKIVFWTQAIFSEYIRRAAVG